MDNEQDNIEYNGGDAPRKKGRGAKILNALLILLLMASWAGGYYLFKDSGTAKAGLKDANGKVAELQRKNNALRSELDTTALSLKRERLAHERLQLENDSLKTLYPINVTKLEVANADGRGNAVSPYGKDIVASNSMYLMPRITYWGLKIGETITLNVRLYDHEGKLVTGSSSPSGYSFSCKIDPVLPGENSQALSGWGGADRGHFRSGTYRYEVWYDDMCLKQVEFKLK